MKLIKSFHISIVFLIFIHTHSDKILTDYGKGNKGLGINDQVNGKNNTWIGNDNTINGNINNVVGNKNRIEGSNNIV